MDVLFELIYHISAIGIVVILTIFMLWQFFDNIRTAMDTPDDEEKRKECNYYEPRNNKPYHGSYQEE